MQIREATIEDIPRLKELAEKYGLNLPDFGDGTIVLAESNEGKITDFIMIRGVYFLEPVVSENPLALNKLWKYVNDKSVEKGVKILRCFAQPKDVSLLKRIGFYRIFKKHIPMETNFYQRG